MWLHCADDGSKRMICRRWILVLDVEAQAIDRLIPSGLREVGDVDVDWRELRRSVEYEHWWGRISVIVVEGVSTGISHGCVTPLPNNV